jgi:predicted nucleic acid-binding protein
MTSLYFDSSAFVKLAVKEAESAALRTFLRDTAGRRVSSALLRTEAIRAVRLVGPDALAKVREGLRLIDLVAIDDRILDAAGALDPRVLRTLAAIHLATAMSVGDDLDAVVTYDERMAEGARSVGLPVIAPR